MRQRTSTVMTYFDEAPKTGSENAQTIKLICTLSVNSIWCAVRYLQVYTFSQCDGTETLQFHTFRSCRLSWWNVQLELGQRHHRLTHIDLLRFLFKWYVLFHSKLCLLPPLPDLSAFKRRWRCKQIYVHFHFPKHKQTYFYCSHLITKSVRVRLIQCVWMMILI